VKRGFVGIADAIAGVVDLVWRGALAVYPVGAYLAANVGAIVRHAVHELLEQMKVIHALLQFVLVLGNVQHAPVRTDIVGADAQEIARRRVEIMWRRGKTHLVGKKLVLQYFPAFRFHLSAPHFLSL
jgi:hypothetical protein